MRAFCLLMKQHVWTMYYLIGPSKGFPHCFFRCKNRTFTRNRQVDIYIEWAVFLIFEIDKPIKEQKENVYAKKTTTVAQKTIIGFQYTYWTSECRSRNSYAFCFCESKSVIRTDIESCWSTRKSGLKQLFNIGNKRFLNKVCANSLSITAYSLYLKP